jgi:hypothetical protein
MWRHGGGTGQSENSSVAFLPAKPQVDRWGGQDLNLRPTDYESVSDSSGLCRDVP